MGNVADGFVSTFRDFNVEGVPSSGKRKPKKEEVRALGETIEAEITQTYDALEGAIAAATVLVESVVSVAQKTWSGLSGLAGTRAGQRGTSAEASGTHTDPVTGLTVPNGGEFYWSVSPAGWGYIGPLVTNTPATSAEVIAGVDATKPVTSATDKAALDNRVRPVEAKQLVNSNRLLRATTARSGMQPYTLNPKTVAYAAACAAAGSPISARRQNRHSRMWDILDRCGFTAWQEGKWFWLFGDTEAQFKINQMKPGTNDLTKVGSPTYTATVNNQYSALRGASTAANTDYYDTGILSNSLDTQDIGLWAQTGFSEASPAADIGDIRARIGLFTNHTSYGNRPAAYVFNGAIASVQQDTGQPVYGAWGSTAGWVGCQRGNATEIEFFHHGNKIETISAAVIASPVSPDNIRILQAANVTPARSHNGNVGDAVLRYMPEAMAKTAFAAMSDYYTCVVCGDPFIYDVGVGPANIYADVIVYGLSMAAICYAYEMKRRGYRVALVGDWSDETIWDIGGMPVNGLGAVDSGNASIITGVWREVLRWINTVFYNRADTTTLANLSPEPRAISAAVRRMLDPTRSSGILPGMDIPVYMTGGVVGVAKSGTAVTSISTRDGRTFYGDMFAAGDYDGDLPYLAGVPCIIGKQANGTGAEVYSGWQGAAGLSTTDADNGVPLLIGSYRIDGDPTSGLLPILSKPSGLTLGGPDPAIQAMNIRMTGNSTWQRYVSWASLKPDNYDAATYEAVGRYLAAYKVAQGSDIPITKVWNPYQLAGNVRDINGSGILSFDAPSSGERYSACGQDIVGRRGVWIYIREWIFGLINWYLYSGDSRIPAAITSGIATYTLDALHHLDPGTWGKLNVPNQIYRREPLYKPVNTGPLGSGVAVLNGNDLRSTDGTTPRNNGTVKTIATINYAWDNKYTRLMDDGTGYIRKYGTITDAMMGGYPGGVNGNTPWPFEISVPDKTVCTNLVFLTTPSVTSVAWAPTRMESFMCQAAECLAAASDYKLRYGGAIQDADYSYIRTEVTTNSPYTYKPLLPQVN